MSFQIIILLSTKNTVTHSIGRRKIVDSSDLNPNKSYYNFKVGSSVIYMYLKFLI